MTRPGVRRILLSALAVLALLASGVLVAQAAKSSKKAPAPKQMKVACAKNSTGVMRYVTRASRCKKNEKAITISKDAPIDACVKLHGTKNGVRGSLSQLRAARRLPAGSTRLSPPANCPREIQPNEQGITLPGPKKTWFCAKLSNGTLRWVSKRSKCRRTERGIWVPQGSPLRTPSGPSNSSPKAENDTAETDKGSAVNIAVLANDNDPDGDPLAVESVDTNGTKGSVSTNPNGTIGYDPNGKFDNLKPGDTATDRFKYKAKDNQGGHSGTAQVDVTIKGKNLAPKGVADSATTDEASTAVVSPLANDTDAEGDTLSLGPIDTSGTDGTVTPHSNGTVTYDPDGQFENLAVGDTGTDTFKYKPNDGTTDGSETTATMTIGGLNDAPTVAITNSTRAYTEGDGATAIDAAALVADVDDGDQIDGAQVSISSNFLSAEDELAFLDANGITGTYNSGTGVLTLTGAASPATYQAALRSVTYENSSQNPSTATRTVTFKVTDEHGDDSNSDTRDIAVTPANDPPVVTTTSGATSYTEGAAAVTIDGGSTVTETDDTNLEGARVRISNNFESGDTLTFVNTANITGTYNSGTGVLTLAGTDTVANYQAALRSVTYDSGSNDNPTGTKTVEFTANDGDDDSNPATKGLTITPVNDAPTVDTGAGSASFTEGGAAAPVDPSFTVSDPDSAQLQSALVSITANFSSPDGDTLNFVDQNGISGTYNSGTGVLTLTGAASVADYQAAIRSITFSNTSDNPSTATRTVSFQATDTAAAASNTDSRNVTVAGTNDAPVVTTSAGATSYTEGGPGTTVDGALTVSDADDTNIEGGQVRISSSFESGDDLVFVDQNGITGNYNSGTGVLTLSGTSSVANYQTALRSIQYRHAGDNPNTGKVVEFKVNDGDVDSNPATKSINLTGVNDGPTLTTTASTLSYAEGNGPVAVDTGLTASDPENDQIGGATVQITAGHVQAEDELAFTNQNGISGAYDDATGKLTLTGTTSVANYQTALRSVAYENNSENPTTTTRTVSFQATDAGTPNEASNVATRDISVARVNDAPVVNTSAGSTSYAEGDPATTVDGALTVSDADDTNLEGGQVRISSNFQSGDDLVFVDQNGISGVYNSGTGVLTLSGTSSVANYQTALRSIQFQTTNDNPNTSKTVEFKTSDGDVDSNLATKNLSITAVNDAPTLNTSAGTAAFVEDTSGPVVADPNLTLSDPDSTQMQGATVEITNGFNSSEDQLVFVNTASITGNYNSGTGVLTLTGNDTVANYQTALRSVRYDNTDTVNPDGATRTVRFQATDAEGAASNPATRDVTVQPVNDAPVVTTSSGSTPYTEGDPATQVDGSLTVTDQDDGNLEGGQVRISAGFQPGDDLVFVNQNGISGVYNSGTGVLTLTGTSSVANYQTALRSIQYQSTNNNPLTLKDVEFKVNDGDVDSNAATKEIAVTPVNSAPAVDATNANLTYTENDPATQADSGLSIDDPENDDLTGGSASITANYQPGQDFLSWTDNNLADNIILDNVNSNSQTVVLAGVDTEASYQAALRSVRYHNTSESPTNVARTVTFSATDQPGLTGSDSRGINVVPVDDPPTAVNDSATVFEDDSATSIPVLTNDTDLDGGPKTISSAGDPANGTVVLTGGSPGAHTGLTYQPDPNYCNDPPGTSPDTFTYTVNGGSSATVSMTVTCVNDLPKADDETFDGNDSAHGNTTLQSDDPSDDKPAPTNPHTEITGDILAGDTDIDGPGSPAVMPGTFATNDGGSVTLESDGDFVYQPAATTSCTDTSDFFDYTVDDGVGTGTSGAAPNDDPVGRVTIAIAGCVWYVNNNASGNSGTSNAPFDSLAQAETASSNNHTVFVFDGDNTSTAYNAGYAMNSGERLIGEHEGLVVDPDGGGALTADTLHPANPGAHPTLTAAPANNEDVVSLDDGNEVRGFNIDPAGAGGGIAGAAGDDGGTIDDVNVDDNGTAGTDPGLDLTGTTGTFNVTDFTYENDGVFSTAPAVQLINSGTVVFGAGDAGDPTKINKTGGKALSVLSTGLGTSSFDEITVANSATGGIDLTNVSSGSTTTFGDGNGIDLDLATSGGTAPAFNLSSARTVSVGGGGTDDVRATGGPAVSVSGTTIDPGLTFDDVDSTNSTTSGISLSGLGTGTFSATSGDITGAQGTSFNVSGASSGDITYPGHLNNGSGQTASITGRTGGTVALSGQVNDTNDAGGGITVSTNTGGVTTFSNAIKTINTLTSGSPTQNNAIVFTQSDGHTLNITGGNLNVDATGRGLQADNSGILNVTGGSNSINAVSGIGLDVTNTDIGPNGVTFNDVHAGNSTAAADPSSGIILNNTGTTNGLVVTGNGNTTQGGNSSGGVIQRTTGPGVSLNTTQSPSFTNIDVQSPTRSGVRGTGVNGFTLQHSTVQNAGEAGVDSGDGALSFNSSGSPSNNLRGAVTVHNNELLRGYEHGFKVVQQDGTISNATITNNLVTQQSGTGGPDIAGTGIGLFMNATSSVTSNLTKATITGNTLNTLKGSGIIVQGGNSSTSGAPVTDIGVPSGSTPGAGTNIVDISNNVVAGSPRVGADVSPMMNSVGIQTGSNGRGQSNFKITGNNLSNMRGIGIGTGGAGSGTHNAQVTNNTVTPNSLAGDLNSVGIGSASDRNLQSDASFVNSVTVNAEIANNTVSGESGHGISVLALDASGTIHRAKVSSNNVGAPNQGGFQSIAVGAGNNSVAGQTPTLCAGINSNTAAQGLNDGAGEPPGIVVRERTGANLQVVGLPDNSTATQAENHLATLNPGSAFGATSPSYAGKRAAVFTGGGDVDGCSLGF